MVFARAEHNVSRADISGAALKVLYTLRDAGFAAYLVGGGVRDLLLGRRPKDFDIATDATPEQIREQFRSCRLIGRRFRLAHVRIGRDIIEVATFRGSSAPDSALADGDRVTVNGRILRDNVYGTVEEDAWRRDFSVNCLYYNIADFSVVDFTGGMADLETGCLRLIGDPEQRLREDPVRMLRALRFAAKLDFELEPGVAAAIPKLAGLLADVSSARLYEEVLKLFLGGAAVRTYQLLRQYGLFGFLFPDTEVCLANVTEEDVAAIRVVEHALENTDARIAQGKPVIPAFLFAAMLWPPLERDARAARDYGLTDVQAIESAGADTLARQVAHVSMPRRYSAITREIWEMQPSLVAPHGPRALAMLERPRFRAGYDFLLLRAQAGEPLEKECDWWTRLQESEGDERHELLQVVGPKRRRRRRRRRGRREPTPEST